MAFSKSLLLCIVVLGISFCCFVAAVPEPTTPEPNASKPKPEKPKPEPEKTSEPSAEVIANYVTLGCLLGACFAAAIVFGLLWWRVRSTLKTVRAQNEYPQKFTPKV